MTNTAQQKITVLTQIGADELVENTINKLITIQIARYQTALQQITRELEEFEEKFKMSSEECYQRFNTGELGDGADFFEWTGLYENLLLYRKRVDMLGAVEQCPPSS